MQRQPFRFIAAAIALLAIAPPVLVSEARADRKTFTLQILFDGGYVFDFSAQDRVDVLNPLATYAMKVFTNAEKTDVVADVKPGDVVTFVPDVSPAAKKPDMPKNGGQDDCQKDADEADVKNRRFIPDLKAIAKRLDTTITVPADIGRITLQGGGSLAPFELGGCVLYGDPDPGHWKKRSMASGVNGIKYQWDDVQGQKLYLKVNGNSTTIYPDAGGRILLFVGSGERHATDTSAQEHDIDEFWRHFGSLFGQSTKKFRLRWLRSYLTDAARSPGIDCPPGAIYP
jgi:hypothetical protein